MNADAIDRNFINDLGLESLNYNISFIMLNLALLLIMFSLYQNYKEFGKELGMEYIMKVALVILFIGSFPGEQSIFMRACDAFFNGMINWWQSENSISDKVNHTLTVLMDCKGPDGWTEILAKGMVLLVSFLAALWYWTRQLALGVVLVAWIFVMWFSPLFLAMVLISELKSIWVNYFSSLFSIALVPIAFVIGDGICWWIYENAYRNMGLDGNELFKREGKKGFIIISDPSFDGIKDVIVTAEAAAKLVIVLTIVIMVLWLTYIVLPKLIMDMFKGGNAGNPMGMPSAMGKQLASGPSTVAGAGKTAGAYGHAAKATGKGMKAAGGATRRAFSKSAREAYASKQSTNQAIDKVCQALKDVKK